MLPDCHIIKPVDLAAMPNFFQQFVHWPKLSISLMFFTLIYILILIFAGLPVLQSKPEKMITPPVPTGLNHSFFELSAFRHKGKSGFQKTAFYYHLKFFCCRVVPCVFNHNDLCRFDQRYNFLVSCHAANSVGRRR